MLVDKEGAVLTYLEADIKFGVNWLAVAGCKMDLADKLPVDLVNWNQNIYTIQVQNVKNPSTSENNQVFTLEVFVDWDDETNTGFTKLAESTTAFIPNERY